MSNNEENIFPVQHAYIIYYTEKSSVLLLLYFVYLFFMFQLDFNPAKRLILFFKIKSRFLVLFI